MDADFPSLLQFLSIAGLKYERSYSRDCNGGVSSNGPILGDLFLLCGWSSLAWPTIVLVVATGQQLLWRSSFYNEQVKSKKGQPGVFENLPRSLKVGIGMLEETYVLLTPYTCSLGLVLVAAFVSKQAQEIDQRANFVNFISLGLACGFLTLAQLGGERTQNIGTGLLLNLSMIYYTVRTLEF